LKLRKGKTDAPMEGNIFLTLHATAAKGDKCLCASSGGTWKGNAFENEI
jgi:hypothetical protein